MPWYWKNYLEKDDLKIYANLWQNMGMLGIFVGFFFFLVGGVCLFVGIFNLDKLPDGPMTQALLCAILGGSAFGMGALLFGGFAVACIAHNTQRRLRALEDRLANFERQHSDIVKWDITPPAPPAQSLPHDAAPPPAPWPPPAR